MWSRASYDKGWISYIYSLFLSTCFSCECTICSLRVKFNIDLSFSEMRTLYWIKLKNIIIKQKKPQKTKEANKQIKKQIEKAKRRVKKSSWKELPWNFPGTFLGNFYLNIVIQVIILVHSLEKGNRVND